MDQFSGSVAEIPTDWLEAFADYIGDHDGMDPDAACFMEIEASFRMRDIQRREGCNYRGSATPDDMLAELARRKAAAGA